MLLLLLYTSILRLNFIIAYSIASTFNNQTDFVISGKCYKFRRAGRKWQ